MPDLLTDTQDEKEILDPDTLQPRKKPIADANEAHAVAKRCFNDRRKANENFGVIRLKYDGEPPYALGELKRLSQGWRANFSNKSISSAVERRVPVFISFLDNTRYLTASRLPDSEPAQPVPETMALPASAPPVDPASGQPAPTVDDNTQDDGGFPGPSPTQLPSPQEKSEIFQRAFTGLVRAWKGYRTWIYQVCNENVLFGNTITGWPDDVEWRPQAFTFDEFAIPGESSHDINECQVTVFRKSFAINEMIDFIQDREAAEAAGWDIDNVVEAVNEATPEDERNDPNKSRLVRYADAVRDGTFYQGTREGAKAVKTYIVNYREYSGKVSQYIVTEDGEKELFYKEDRFERMADAASLFSLQWGNGKFYGSIGLGRVLLGFHIARDRNSCRMIDAAYLNSFMRLSRERGTDKNEAPFRMSWPVMTFDADADDLKVPPHEASLADAEAVEQYLKAQIEVLSETFLPKPTDTSGEKATAREIIDNARREDFMIGDTLARFYGQFSACVETMQRRVFSRENILAARDFLKAEKDGKTLLSEDEYSFLQETHDKEEVSEYAKHIIPADLDRESVMVCVDLLREGLTPLDIYRISRSPASEPMGDTPALLQQKIAQLFQQLMGNPGIDQVKMLRDYVAAVGNPALAKEWCLTPDQANAGGIEQAQKQLIELGTLVITGKPMPVAPSDQDAIHRNVLKNAFQEAPQTPEALAANPVAHNAVTLALAHYNDHLAAGKQKGEKGPAFEADYDLGQHVGAQLSKADAIVARQNAVAQAQQPAAAQQSPAQPQLQPAPQ